MSEEPFAVVESEMELRQKLSTLRAQYGEVSVELKAAFQVGVTPPLKLKGEDDLSTLRGDILALFKRSPTHQIGIWPHFG